MIYITRKEHFNAAHKLYREDWTFEKNEEVFGRCANTNWHGHNYDLFVTVKGQINEDTGFVIDLKDLKKLIVEHVVDKLDHKNLNIDVDFMRGKMASTEVLAVEIWKQLASKIKEKGAALHCVKLYETANNYVEYFGE
ncbi:6-pyruvoyl tetrahydrobiopterin synthase [Pelobium manganitolerans]|uniref:6-carboxy-5,6,7,8-tetrahydropterin synthase n=1 Tax=Pelobium manganitolerans TaxID=1842495 RepID=A0A419SA36_9SPHI|nr:6-carboxytetrahydropterin synthase [Pelobium manganitolerans]RKD19067.1 6-pyruvoyl tetrahydrobiopterin synthase [Pelobium manganitolerans]